jgi:hypothetical protein
MYSEYRRNACPSIRSDDLTSDEKCFVASLKQFYTSRGYFMLLAIGTRVVSLYTNVIVRYHKYREFKG